MFAVGCEQIRQRPLSTPTPYTWSTNSQRVHRELGEGPSYQPGPTPAVAVPPVLAVQPRWRPTAHPHVPVQGLMPATSEHMAAAASSNGAAYTQAAVAEAAAQPQQFGATGRGVQTAPASASRGWGQRGQLGRTLGSPIAR